MTENPYEAPQTIDQPPLLAEEVRVVSVDLAALAAAAEGCSRAGMCYLVAMLLTAGEFFGLSFMPREMFGTLWMLLIFAPFVVSLYFIGAGVCLNTLACRRFKLELSDPKLKQLYAGCQRASWLKASLIVCMLFTPYASSHGGRIFFTIWDVLWTYVPAIVLLINSVITVIQHFRGLNELGEMLHTKTADHLATLYLFTGLPLTLIVVVLFILSLGGSHHVSGPPPAIIAVVPLLLLPMFAAYQVAYRQLSQAFLARSKTR